MRQVYFSFCVVFFLSCTSQKNVLKKVSQSSEPKLSKVFEDPEKYELQVLLSRISRNPDGSANFKDYQYRLDDESYFYPASTAKLPVAVLSLEKLRELQQKGIKINKYTQYSFANDSVSSSIADDIKAIFAVSDNEAYNRLFEFLGQDYINSKLRAKGVAPVRISHRFSGPSSAETDTKQMIFQTNDGLYGLPTTSNCSPEKLQLKNVQKGRGFVEDDEQIDKPFDFSLKNYFPLSTQHSLMKRLFFPENFQDAETFQLQDEDVQFLKNSMAILPREAGYTGEDYTDSYVKFFLYGDSKENITGNVKIYNKVGYAYGTLTETAYVVDKKNDVEFLLSATLLVNENGIFNDNNYEYNTIGIPFLAELGRKIYQLELEQKKKD